MADMEKMKSWNYENVFGSALWREDTAETGYCYYGPNAIKYDTAGVSLSFISKRRWWNPSNERQWCNETVGLLLMVVWPDMFEIKKEEAYVTVTMGMNLNYDGEWAGTSTKRLYASISPQEQTPDQTAYMIQYYFESLK
jgi:hypothetical protein